MTQTLPTTVEPIKPDLPAPKPPISWRDISWGDRAFCLSYWTEAGLEKESLLQAVMDFFLLHKYFISVDQGWSNWDLEIYRGIWSRVEVKVCTENHGGSKRLLRVRCALRMSQLATMAIFGYSLFTIVAIILGMPEIAAVTVVLGMLNVGVILYQNFQLGRILYQVIEIIAKRVYLLPIQATSHKPAPETAILQQ